MSKINFSPGDRVIFAQRYLLDEPNQQFYGALGTVVSQDPKTQQVCVLFDELGHGIVQATDLDFEPEMVDISRFAEGFQTLEDLQNTDKNTLIRDKLEAQETDPGHDDDITTLIHTSRAD